MSEQQPNTVRWYQFAYVDKCLFLENKHFIKASVGFYKDEDHFRSAQNIEPERPVVKTNSYVDFPIMGDKLETLKNFLEIKDTSSKAKSQERSDKIKELEKIIVQLEERITHLEDVNGL